MGNKQHQNFEWEDTFNVLQRNFNDHTLILQKKQNKQEYLGRQMLSTDKKQSQEIKRLIKIKYQSTNPFLTKLTEVYYNNDQAYCSPEDKIYLIFEKPKQTLRQEILARKFANEPFTEEEADIILESGAKAIRSLKEIQHPHNNISTSSIFIDTDRRILLGDPWITPPVYNQEMTQNVFACPSPQKILLQNDQIMSICPYRSDLFSLGTVVLQALNYQHMDILYQKGFRKLLEPKLKQKLNKIKNDQLRYKLSVILSHDPHNRDEIYSLYRTAGLAVSQVKKKPTNKQPTRKINNTHTEFDKSSPIVQLSKQVLNHDNKIANNIQLVQTQHPTTNKTNNYQQQQANTYHNNTTITQNRITIPQPAYPSVSSNYPPTYTGTTQYSNIPHYYPTSTSTNTNYYNPSTTPITFNNHNYQRINYMTHTNPTNSLISTNYLANDYRIGLPTTTAKLDDKPINQKVDHIDVSSHVNTTTATNLDINTKTNINNTAIPNIVGKQDIKNQQPNNNGSVDNNLLPISIKSSNDLVNTSGNIRYIESSFIQQPPVSIGNYNIKEYSQPNNTQTHTNIAPITIPQNTSQKQQPIKKQKTQPAVNPNPEKTTKNTSIQAHKQTPDKKPSRKYNSTIKQQTDEYSYSGERETEEDYEYVVEEYEAGRYEGQKYNGMRNGFGKFYYKQGSVYEGQWRDNLMNGKGNLYYGNGKLAYEGDWRMDEFHGLGKVFNEDQFELKGNYNYNDFSDINDYWASYEGELHSDRRHGKGKIKISNGQIFVGEFVADSVEGPGKFYTLSGEIIQGIWKNNKLIKKL